MAFLESALYQYGGPFVAGLDPWSGAHKVTPFKRQNNIQPYRVAHILWYKNTTGLVVVLGKNWPRELEMF